jgi:hypothetical protein
MEEDLLDFLERYDHCIIPEPNTGCHIWFGAQITAGYGHGNRDGEHFYAHRAAFECEHGIGSLNGLICRHSCDFPPCCNTSHLLAGSVVDNYEDARRRGLLRIARGEGSARAILLESDVLTIRSMALDRMTIEEITGLYPVKRGAIIAILSGKSWTHLGPPVDYVRVKGDPPHDKGEDSPRAILTEQQVLDIRARLAAGARGIDLADKFDVHPATISAIKHRRLWAHLTEK